jgi:methylated-DNA-[protein]-cysteine S-methyltransferase
VYELTRKIPRGKVTTYKAIAEAINMPGASRAVGNALHVNPYAPEVPCHRVVRSDGMVGGFARGNQDKIELLRAENVLVKNGYIQNFNLVYFNVI